MPKVDGTTLTYNYRTETGVHEFVFHQANRAAVDDWLDYMNQIYDGKTQQDKIYFLLDLRQSGSLPMTYSSSKGLQWMKALKVHPKVRLAMINKPEETILTALFDRLLQTMRLGHLKSANFYGDADDKALEWLLEQ